MRLLVAGVLFFAFFSVCSGQAVQRPAQFNKDEQALRRLEDEWLGSYLRGDKATFDRIVADDFTGTDESAKFRNKAQEREVIQAPPSTIKASFLRRKNICELRTAISMLPWRCSLSAVWPPSQSMVWRIIIAIKPNRLYCVKASV